MEFVGQYQSFLIIPTGATSGARIEINTNNSGAILVYNANNQLVDSISPSGGFDPAGNAYPPGIANMSAGNTPEPVVVMDSGAFWSGFQATSGTSFDFIHAGFFSTESPGATVIQGGFQSTTLPITIILNDATPGHTVPNTSADRVTITASTNAVYAGLYGALVGGDPTNALASWQTVGIAVPFKTGWSGSTTFFSFGGGSGLLQYRKSNEDEIKIVGVCTSATGAGTTIFTLPSGYFNTAHTTFGSCLRNRASTVTAQNMVIDTFGNVIVEITPAAGDQYQFSFYGELGNIP